MDIHAHIKRLPAYKPTIPMSDIARNVGVHEQELAQLASNENPLGASPRAMQALSNTPINHSLYPDTDCHALTSELSSTLNVPNDWLIVGAGSENVLSIAATTLLDPRRAAVFSQYSFQAFGSAVQRVGAESIVVPSPDFYVDLQGLIDAITPSTSVVYLANPGNPTGTHLPPHLILDFIRAIPSSVAVILDEAYREYLSEDEAGDAIEWVRRFPNLLVTRTFSKAYGLAGLRIGYGIAQPPLISIMQRVRSPFCVTQAAQIAAIAALHDQDFLRETVRVNAEGREQLAAGFEKLGLRYLPSKANFILVEVGDGAAVAQRLQQYALLVRPVSSYGLPSWLRISVGTAQVNRRLLSALERELESIP